MFVTYLVMWCEHLIALCVCVLFQIMRYLNYISSNVFCNLLCDVTNKLKKLYTLLHHRWSCNNNIIVFLKGFNAVVVRWLRNIKCFKRCCAIVGHVALSWLHAVQPRHALVLKFSKLRCPWQRFPYSSNRRHYCHCSKAYWHIASSSSRDAKDTKQKETFVSWYRMVKHRSETTQYKIICSHHNTTTQHNICCLIFVYVHVMYWPFTTSVE